MLSQQKGSRLRPYVRTETINGKSKAFDRIGAVDPVLKTSRHSNTPQLDTPHSRRWCYLADYEWADLIDDLDKVRLLNDPQSEYVMAAMWSMGRAQDDVIITAFDADVNTGETASGTASHPNSQKVAATDGTAFSNLNVLTLRNIKLKFDQAEVDPSIPRHIAVSSSQLYALLGDDQITSQDYNAVKALVRGEVDTFMGFKFHQTERLLFQTSALSANAATGAVGAGTAVNAATCRKVVAWAQDGMILGVGADMKASIDKRPDKSNATQAYASMSVGSVRMEEVKVVIAFCQEA
jgi:hypothetical protein